jgi:hypothetical protein
MNEAEGKRVNYVIINFDLLKHRLKEQNLITNYYEYINKQIHMYNRVLETKRQHTTHV